MNNRYYRGAGETYLKQYPRLEKWINQCVNCQYRGHKPEMPNPNEPCYGEPLEKLRNWSAFCNIRRYFTELSLNQQGLCDHCANR